MMDVLKQLKLLTADLCWTRAADVVILSVKAKESVESESYRGFSESAPVKSSNMFARKTEMLMRFN